MKKTLIRNYAKLIARTGASIQKGQRVVIMAQLDQPEFITVLVEECYRAGASEVMVEWQYQPLEKLASRFESVRELGNVPRGRKRNSASGRSSCPSPLRYFRRTRTE